MKQITNPVKVGSLHVGARPFCVFAGPCSVESQEQFLATAKAVKAQSAVGLRGGVFKLRTDPNSFQGLGENAFSIARAVKNEVDLPFVSEITDPRQISDLDSVVDMFQVGSRNMHNYALLKELGGTKKPILLKRGFAATVKEWLLAAEYLIRAGNDRVVLCERGIRTFETSTRNTFDVNAIAFIKQNTHFPVLADPSHGTGVAGLVTPIALAAAAAGADGLLIEVHPNPKEALSDGYQSLDFEQFAEMSSKLKKLLLALDREIAHA